jgi:hypothetical protein
LRVHLQHGNEPLADHSDWEHEQCGDPPVFRRGISARAYDDINPDSEVEY